ncbi:hypothetical protein F5Y10DRAFT_31793 [Nemania abortiva]|nr:hypothetical protein F5Y10DRAFT_31793 [Nemania abortiva]
MYLGAVHRCASSSVTVQGVAKLTMLMHVVSQAITMLALPPHLPLLCIIRYTILAFSLFYVQLLVILLDSLCEAEHSQSGLLLFANNIFC